MEYTMVLPLKTHNSKLPSSPRLRRAGKALNSKLICTGLSGEQRCCRLLEMERRRAAHNQRPAHDRVFQDVEGAASSGWRPIARLILQSNRGPDLRAQFRWRLRTGSESAHGKQGG